MFRDFAIKHGRPPKRRRSLSMRDSPKRWRGDSLAIYLAGRDFEREAGKRYKGFVVRTRLKKISDEAMRCNAFMREEEFRRFPHRSPVLGKSTDERVLRSNREVRDVFRVHFRDRFARCPDLPVQEFRSYLADFPCLGGRKQLSARVWLLNANCPYSEGYVQPLVCPGSHS